MLYLDTRARIWRVPMALAVAALLTQAAPVRAEPNPGLTALEEPLDLSTPRRAADAFILACRDGEYVRAAHALDLRSIPKPEQAERGPELAEHLKAVLDRELWLDMSKISDEPSGDPADGTRIDVLGHVELQGRPFPIELWHVPLSDGTKGWVFSRRTVEHVPDLYRRYGPHWLAQRLPPAFSRVQLADVLLWQWLGLLVAIGASWGLGLALGGMLVALGSGVASRTRAEWDDAFIESVRGPARLFVGLLMLWVLIQPLNLAVPPQQLVNRALLILLVGNVAWFATRFVQFVADMLERTAIEQAAGEEDSELRVRGVQTQVRVLRRVASIIILVIAIALMLLQFEVVRTVGMSMLASAGVAGIVLGFAAQKSIANLLAGIQLSITQPVRIGDTVIIEGEWGQIEEINLTYVVVRIWDERRLVVPIGNFLEKPFQNWTRTSKELLGTVYVYADYRVPMDAVREELDRILDGNPKFDGRAKGVVVTDATERTVQLRPLVSAKDSGDLWQLRCEVREKLITWLQQYEDGAYLPRTRIVAEGLGKGLD